MLSTNTYEYAVRVHEAAYKVAARKLGIRLRKTRTDLGLRRYANDVFDVAAAVEQRGAEAAATILLIARAAVGALAPAHLADCSYDQIEAQGLQNAGAAKKLTSQFVV